MKLSGITIMAALSCALLAGCGAPAPGSKAWCEKIAKKPQGQISQDEASTYADKCVNGEGDPNYK